MRPISSYGMTLGGLLIAVCWIPASRALQLVEARDGVAVEAILSIKEPTRIRIEGAPIVDVFGNIRSGACGTSTSALVPAPVVPTGEVLIECDREKGEIYVRPIAPPEGSAGKPINLFVSSARATYTLLLRRADTPADTIVIRDRSTHADKLAAGSSTAVLGPSANHVRAMKAMLVAMASDEAPPDMRIEELHRPVQLWAEAQFSLMRRYEGRGLVGERYLLRNISPTVMVLAEQEFDRADSGAGGQVLGVSIENHNLRAGEATNVFVIRRGSEQ